MTELESLQKFAARIMAYWPEGDVDGGELQDIAEECGLILLEPTEVPCGDDCACRDYWNDGDVSDCYRFTEVMQRAQAVDAAARQGQ